MQASRVLRTVASSSKAFLIPPRTSWDIAKSAASAGFNMLTNRAVRDNFVETLNKGTIVPDVLSQADHGAAMVLALYNDLDSPLMKKYKFDANEFCEGVKPALENYHEVLACLENELYTKDGKKEGKSDTDISSDGENQSLDGDEKLDRHHRELIAGSFDQGAELERMVKILSSENMGDLYDQNWTKEAEEDPESFAGKLKSMVTDEYFTYIQALSKTNQLLLDKNDALLYEEGSGEIRNVALLSARAKVIEDSTEEDASIENIKDDELNLKEEEVGDAKIPVAVQVEVLYDVQQTYCPLLTKSSGEEKKESKNEEEKSVTRNNVWVGVFEGWLNGNPDGSSDVRWKLVLNRQAWEFPLLSGYNQYR